MPLMADDLDETGDQGADLAYRWTIRTLYAVAIAMNVWILWIQLADDPEAQAVKDQVRGWAAKLLRPLHLDRQVKREVGGVIFEAMGIVEEADAGAE